MLDAAPKLLENAVVLGKDCSVEAVGLGTTTADEVEARSLDESVDSGDSERLPVGVTVVRVSGADSGPLPKAGTDPSCLPDTLDFFEEVDALMAVSAEEDVMDSWMLVLVGLTSGVERAESDVVRELCVFVGFRLGILYQHYPVLN